MIRLSTPTAAETESKLISCGATEKEAVMYTAWGEGVFERAYRLYSDETFRELREDSLTVLISFLEGKLPFDSLKELSKTKMASEAVTFMLSFMRDMLLYKYKKQILSNTDRLSEIAALCSRFTIGKINSIIDIMTDTKSRLMISAIHASIIDSMFTKISEVI